MRPLLMLTCVILLLVDNHNFIFGASQHRILTNLQDQASQNYERQQARTEQQQARQGQGEYYVPTYFANPYQSYQQLLTSLAAEEQLESEQEQLRQLQQQFPVTSSKFPSLVSPSISLSGHDGLSKYKPSKSKAKSAAVSEAEFRNLLASIKAIQPVVNERLDQIGEYIKEAGHRENAPQRGRTLPAREVGQAEYLGSLPYQWSRDASEASAGTGKSSSSKVLPFQAEGMANPYDEISDEDLNQEESDTVKRQGPAAKQQAEVSARGEPKARRKLTNESPSSLHNDRNVVLAPKAYQQSISDSVSKKESILGNMSDVYFVAIVACVSSVAIFSVIGAGYCFYKVQQSNKAAQDVEFPAYGVIGPASRHDTNNGAKCSSPPADRKLAQSAQMYHYHHQKQQMISNDKNANIPRNTTGSDIESDEENEDGEYTVYECPGLAPTGEMEVKNPLFQDDLTPMSSPSVNGNVKQDSPKQNGAGESKLAKESVKNETD